MIEPNNIGISAFAIGSNTSLNNLIFNTEKGWRNANSFKHSSLTTVSYSHCWWLGLLYYTGSKTLSMKPSMITTITETGAFSGFSYTSKQLLWQLVKQLLWQLLIIWGCIASVECDLSSHHFKVGELFISYKRTPYCKKRVKPPSPLCKLPFLMYPLQQF